MLQGGINYSDEGEATVTGTLLPVVFIVIFPLF